MARPAVLRSRAGSHLEPQYDQEGNVIEVETREDEEQNVKLAETLELLVAAGYFRARIKGLSPFDKASTQCIHRRFVEREFSCLCSFYRVSSSWF
uniref:CCDC93 N-terminal domain-containing protein n=1 Tax=Eptatretus burgeri TaxID=7764 RepID=A0A8C4QRR2_EPTBU